MPTIELKPIKESAEDFDTVEKRIKELFKRTIYFPLLKELGAGHDTVRNSNDGDLINALRMGRLTFSKGTFSGKLSAGISKELRTLGAVFDRKSGTYKIHEKSLPRGVREAISASDFRFKEKLEVIDKKLAQLLPEEIAARLKVSDAFDRTLWKTDRAFHESVKGITVAPNLTPEQRKRIADEWQTNMHLWIEDFTKKEILQLRKDMKASVFAGNRYGSAIKTIQDSYGVSANKAKFLARQETSLLMTKFKQTRYEDAGVKEYRWGTVAGSKLHPVRPSHKILEGKIFRWDSPPVTTPPGEPTRRNNPGQDYNCRCFARPILRFKKDGNQFAG